MADTWQMGEAEAVYKIFKEFPFRKSISSCIFVQTCLKKERSKFLLQVYDNPHYQYYPQVSIQNRPEEYVKK